MASMLELGCFLDEVMLVDLSRQEFDVFGDVGGLIAADSTIGW